MEAFQSFVLIPVLLLFYNQHTVAVRLKTPGHFYSLDFNQETSLSQNTSISNQNIASDFLLHSTSIIESGLQCARNSSCRGNEFEVQNKNLIPSEISGDKVQEPRIGGKENAVIMKLVSDPCRHDSSICGSGHCYYRRPWIYICNCTTYYGGPKCQSHAPRSCNDLKQAYPGDVRTGWNEVELKQGKLDYVFCDMETDGGGWTLVSQFIIQNTTAGIQSINKASQQFITSKYENMNYKLSTHALDALRNWTLFTQVRFECYKSRAGRKVHITTTKDPTGIKVVDYLTGRSPLYKNRPPSCNSFVVLPGDTSVLSKNCLNWTSGTWGASYTYEDQRLFDSPFSIDYNNIWGVMDTLPNPVGAKVYSCDDSLQSGAYVYNQGGYWKVYIR